MLVACDDPVQQSLIVPTEFRIVLIDFDTLCYEPIEIPLVPFGADRRPEPPFHVLCEPNSDGHFRYGSTQGYIDPEAVPSYMIVAPPGRVPIQRNTLTARFSQFETYAVGRTLDDLLSLDHMFDSDEDDLYDVFEAVVGEIFGSSKRRRSLGAYTLQFLQLHENTVYLHNAANAAPPPPTVGADDDDNDSAETQ